VERYEIEKYEGKVMHHERKGKQESGRQFVVYIINSSFGA
jgi:hypothetical protein